MQTHQIPISYQNEPYKTKSILLSGEMNTPGNNISNEKKTVRVMITMYCNSHHNNDGKNLCQECTSLLDYATIRIDKCTFGIDKPSCEKCPVHCYKKGPKEEIKRIMRYSGPRMLFRHPVLTIKHLINNYLALKN